MDLGGIPFGRGKVKDESVIELNGGGGVCVIIILFEFFE